MRALEASIEEKLRHQQLTGRSRVLARAHPEQQVQRALRDGIRRESEAIDCPAEEAAQFRFEPADDPDMHRVAQKPALAGSQRAREICAPMWRRQAMYGMMVNIEMTR